MASVLVRIHGACACLALLGVPLAAQGVRVNGELAHGEGFAAGDTLAFQLSPDGRWAVFLADPAGNDLMELFSAPADGSAGPRKLNGPLVPGGEIVERFEFPLPPHTVGFYALPLAISADRVVYRADQDTDEVQELYSAPIDGSAPAMKVSGVLPANGDVGSLFEVTPDGARVLFLADVETDGVLELHSAPVDGSAPPVRLNAPLPAGGGFREYESGERRVSPDGRTVVYRVDQIADEVYELFAVPSDGSALPIRLNSPLVTGGDVVGFEVSTDGSHVVYTADQELDDTFEVWSVPLDVSAPPVRLSRPMVAGGDAKGFALTPDATRVIYTADAIVDGRTDLYAVALAGGPSTLLASLQPAGNVYGLGVSADSARVVYRGDVETDEVFELFSVPIDGSQPPVKLNAPLVTGGDVGDANAGVWFVLAPGARRVVYRADQATNDRLELWSVPIEGGAAPVRLNAPLTSYSRLGRVFRCSADGRFVVYQAYSSPLGRFELWSVPIQGGAPPLRLNERLVSGGDVAEENDSSPHHGFDLTADGARAVYRADQNVNDQFALWSVPLDHRKRAREISGRMEAGPVLGDVQDFAWTPDGTRLLYTADKNFDEDFVLFSAAPDPRDVFARFPTAELAPGRTLRVSPDGRYVATHRSWSCPPEPGCVGGTGLYCATVDGSEPWWGAGAGNFAGPFAFDSQGDWLVWSSTQAYYHNPQYEGGLFSRRTDGSGTNISLTEPPGMVPYFGTGQPVISPDGQRVVFVQDGYDVPSGLMSVPIDRSQSPVVLSAPSFDPRQSILLGHRITPDSRTVVYVADEGVLGTFELHRAPLDGSAPSERVGPPLAPFADVDPAFLVTPDGEHVLALVDASRDGSLELWSFPLFPWRGTEPIRLSTKAVPGGGVGPGRVLNADEYDGLPQPQFVPSPDGTRIVYRADQDIDEVWEIYSVPADGSAPALKLNAPLAPGQGVPPFGFHFDPTGALVVFAAPDGAGVLRLHVVPSDASAAPTALGGPFVAGGSLWLSTFDGGAYSFQLTPDGATVVYVADQRTDETLELFAAPLDGGPAWVLSGALVPGGDVRAQAPWQGPFALSPDGKHVAYLADQSTDEVFELFLSWIEMPSYVRPARSPRPR